MKISRENLREQRKRRVRSKIFGTKERPRLSVFKSLRGISVQIINDENGKTLLAENAKKAKLKNRIEDAKKIGLLIAKKCLEKNIKQVVFDRAGYKYHGKLKALADGVREGGLKV
jgi:large subunit ribosomal protein L18